MALSQGHIANFQTLLDAANAGRLALMECTCATTGKPRAVVCAVNPKTATRAEFIPFGHLSEGNPFDDYIPPE